MESWLFVGLIAGLFAVIGNALDRFLVKNQKYVLHDMMVSWWCVLAENKIPDLHIRAATSVLELLRPLLISKSIAKLLFLSIIISWLLTSTAFIIGTVAQYGVDTVMSGSGIPLPPFTYYIANYPFDALTIAVTYYALKIVASSNTVKGIVAIILDCTIAIVLVVISWSVMSWSLEIGVANDLPGTSWSSDIWQEEDREKLGAFLELRGISNDANIVRHMANEESDLFFHIKIAPESIFKSFSATKVGIEHQIKYVINEENRSHILWTKEHYIPLLSETAMSLTTFVPSLLYLFYILFLMVSKLVLEFLRLFSLQFLDVATEGDPKNNPKDFIPGTLFGATMGIIVALVNTLAKILK